jgi:hypothetical protein
VPKGASGSSFTGLTIEGAGGGGIAMSVHREADVVVRASVLRGRPGCLVQPPPGAGEDPGVVTVEDSVLSSDTGVCVTLPLLSTIRRSTVRRTGADDGPTPVVSTCGLIEDSRVEGGLELRGIVGRAARVDARGARALWGSGHVVDSLASSTGPWPGVSADSNGGTLTVVNVTALSALGPGLAATQSTAVKPGSPGRNTLDVTNAIARGVVDVRAGGVGCAADENCVGGRVVIRSSNAATVDIQGLGATIVDDGDNQIGDPRFADPAAGDFHLLPGSPAIDAGIGVTDLGAYESTPVVPGDPAGAPPTGPAAPAADAPSIRGVLV